MSDHILAEPLYACCECGKLRTKAQGGTVFSVCDECWDRLRFYMAPAGGQKQETIDEFLNRYVNGDDGFLDRELPKYVAAVSVAARIEALQEAAMLVCTRCRSGLKLTNDGFFHVYDNNDRRPCFARSILKLLGRAYDG